MFYITKDMDTDRRCYLYPYWVTPGHHAKKYKMKNINNSKKKTQNTKSYIYHLI